MLASGKGERTSGQRLDSNSGIVKFNVFQRVSVNRDLVPRVVTSSLPSHLILSLGCSSTHIIHIDAHYYTIPPIALPIPSTTGSNRSSSTIKDASNHCGRGNV